MSTNSRRVRRSLVGRLSAFLVAVAVLTFCATAAAEVRSGESTVPLLNQSPAPEVTLVQASASYDTVGTVNLSFTTAAPPQALSGGLPNKARFGVTLLRVQGNCDPAGAEAAMAEVLEAASASKPLPPIMGILGSYGQQETPVYEIFPRLLGFAKKTVSGAQTTVEFASVMIANVGFNCAYVSVAAETEPAPQSGSAIFVALKPVPVPPPPGPAPAPIPAPGPAPAQLSIAKPKRLELQPGRWKTAKLTVSNVGGTVTAQGSLRVKAAKGISVKPASQKLPALNPGDSWTVSVRIKATDAAKATSTVSYTVSVPGVDPGTGSLTVALR
jgi:hypothetical protein